MECDAWPSRKRLLWQRPYSLLKGFPPEKRHKDDRLAPEPCHEANPQTVKQSLPIPARGVDTPTMYP